MELISSINKSFLEKFRPLAAAGVRKFDLMGGRRSGKTWEILQILSGRVLRGEVVNVATMTSEQGRLGAYQDVCDIINGSPIAAQYLTVCKQPREVRCVNGGRMFFNSYIDPERAKGIACDWLYMNEGNNFTERQYIDLSASVRKGVFVDRNPNEDCWTERNGFALIHSTWQDNRDHLTPQQIAWFESLKEKAESPSATSADRAFYRMYYLGEYAEILGDIFTPNNIRVERIPERLSNFEIYCDPSALWGADYFACVLSAVADGIVYIIDTHSVNVGSKDDIVLVFDKWTEDVRNKYGCVPCVNVEVNGATGKEFYLYIQKRYKSVQQVSQSLNKFERIMSHYDEICNRVVFDDTKANNDYLVQVYGFGKKCDHDDNIDAVDTTYSIHRWKRHIT